MMSFSNEPSGELSSLVSRTPFRQHTITFLCIRSTGNPEDAKSTSQIQRYALHNTSFITISSASYTHRLLLTRPVGEEAEGLCRQTIISTNKDREGAETWVYGAPLWFMWGWLVYDVAGKSRQMCWKSHYWLWRSPVLLETQAISEPQDLH